MCIEKFCVALREVTIGGGWNICAAQHLSGHLAARNADAAVNGEGERTVENGGVETVGECVNETVAQVEVMGIANGRFH